MVLCADLLFHLGQDLTMSGLSGGTWSKLCTAVGIDANDVEVKCTLPPNRVKECEEFKWDTRNENQQNKEYMEFIQPLFNIPINIHLIDIHRSKQFLSVFTAMVNVKGQHPACKFLMLLCCHSFGCTCLVCGTASCLYCRHK